MNTHPVSELIAKIQSTNNGYLFAPSPMEILTAQKHPTVFSYQFGGGMFPHKIALK